ncbi:alpha/beta fold hydrolase [Sphingomonas sp. SRS2]|uniref:alpha/beta fold hydrolase n=1 Tax=Sphingomonas sp. SRS2 TaxID=133190 RepID=UPI0006979AF7|nr:alpha/beta hydrolase [Sphingomonas sp. SRS2]
MATVSVKGRDIGYEESGSGEPLILIHGGQSDRHQFDLFRPLMEKGIRAIAYDQRDTRENLYEGAPPYTTRDLAEDCANFLDAMGLSKAHIMGTSYGGLIAMMTAIHFPERVQSLILAATTPSFAMAEPVVTQATGNRDAAAIEQFSLRHVGGSDDVDADPVRVAETKAAIRPGPPEAVARRMSAARQHECRDDLHRITAPTLVLRGGADPFISDATAAWTAGQIDGAKLVLVPDAGHSLTRHHRAQVAPIVCEFVLNNKIRGHCSN